MNLEEFKKHAKQTIDYICKLEETLPERKVYPNVSPGYLRKLLPDHAPEQPEKWNQILKDTEKYIMPGITHWQHPQFFGYFPHGDAYSSLLADMVSDAIAVVPFSWTASPACSELEIIIMDWLCKALDLPEHFLSKSKGGGTIQASSSDAIFNCIMAARSEGIKKLRGDNLESHDSAYLPKLIAYCSEESHSCVEKGVKLALLRLKILPTDSNYMLRGETVKQAIEEDIANGFTPIFLSANFGSTSSTVIDRFDEIGPICQKYGIWFHIDAAYAGFSLICPEMRKYIKGIEYADSFNSNASKWFLVHCDCTCLWIKDRNKYCPSFIIDPLYLEEGKTDITFDLRHWGVPLTRRFRSLKLWYTIRTYGLEGLRNYQRNHMMLAKYFEKKIIEDGQFDILNKVIFGLVTFRLRNSTDKMNQELVARLNDTRCIFLIPTILKGKYAIRMCVNSQHARESDIDTAFGLIKNYANIVIQKQTNDRCSKSSIEALTLTKEVPKELFNRARKRTTLMDMATMIFLSNDDDDDNNDDDNLSGKISETLSLH